MLGQDALNALKQLLWAAGGEHVYALLDGASVPGLLERLYAPPPRPGFHCLLQGDQPPDVAHVAPYIVALERDSELSDWVLGSGWGNHWASFVLAGCALRPLWFHLRTLCTVYGPDGNPKLFRYYDPRVLRAFLPTCSAEQVLQMFGPAARFVVEGTEPATALVFAHAAGSLQRSARKLAGFRSP
jgi:hypothetical protein